MARPHGITAVEVEAETSPVEVHPVEHGQDVLQFIHDAYVAGYVAEIRVYDGESTLCQSLTYAVRRGTVSVGMNTIVIPLKIPGTDNGNIVFAKTWNLSAPRSSAASI